MPKQIVEVQFAHYVGITLETDETDPTVLEQMARQKWLENDILFEDSDFEVLSMYEVEDDNS